MELELRYQVWGRWNAVAQLLLSATVGIVVLAGIRSSAMAAAAAALHMTALAGLLFWVRREGRKKGYSVRLQPADWITLFRFAITAAIGTVLALEVSHSGYLVVIMGTIATILDAVDGWVARRCGPTRYGAIMDIESDAGIIQIGVVGAVAVLEAPVFLLVIGAWRYIYVLSIPYPRSPLPAGFRPVMRIIGVASIIGIGFWYLAFVPRPLAACIAGITVVLHSISFLLTYYFQLSAGATGETIHAQ